MSYQFLDEIPTWDLNATVKTAKNEWNEQVLSKIDVTHTNETQLEMFYTGLYSTTLISCRRIGRDTFRCTHALITLILPKRQIEIVKSLIDIWRHELHARRTESKLQRAGARRFNADNILADACVKGLQGGINWTDVYLAMKTNAEVLPHNTFDSEYLTGSTKEGRSALPDGKKSGFVTPAYGRSISKTVEVLA
ncbi:hypothetical protein HYFRA_00001920 [Hymenoscyphus fraxineus]|uniref:Glycosyl hydrolase family 92 domain-containing protein n=1 Tax=Hymenoscyphus fraxineus TaxID=746836 RepID=A0A9N9KKT5_9HELO|nr:hypothetical protein HYFRA_00001920 [Hymenoscyphus fraxineus]